MKRLKIVCSDVNITSYNYKQVQVTMDDIFMMDNTIKEFLDSSLVTCSDVVDELLSNDKHRKVVYENIDESDYIGQASDNLIYNILDCVGEDIIIRYIREKKLKEIGIKK